MHYYRGENSCSCNFGKVNVPHLQYPVCGMTAVKETSLVSFFHFRVYVASVLDMILSVTVKPDSACYSAVVQAAARWQYQENTLNVSHLTGSQMAQQKLEHDVCQLILASSCGPLLHHDHAD